MINIPNRTNGRRKSTGKRINLWYNNIKMTKAEEKWSLVRETVGNGRLSVIMPMFNLGESVAENLRQTAELFEHHQVNVELIPVDDGSADSSACEIASFNAAEFSHVKFTPVLLKANGGKGAALRSGFEASCGEYIMLLDGDLDINPKQTAEFFDSMISNNADVVVGSKRHPRSVVQYPWHRRIASWVYFTLVRLMVGIKVTDTQTGMKLFKRAILGEALSRMLVKTYAFDLELLSIAASRGAKIAEAPVVIRFGNKFGALKMRTVIAMAKDSLAVFYRLRILKYYKTSEAPRLSDDEPMVSIVIACPNRSWMLDECLNAIAQQSYTNFETLVMPDEEVELDEKLMANARVRVFVTGKVRPAEKRNLGIKKAQGSIVAFIDDDAYPDSHWLEYAVRFFAEPTIGAVGGPGITAPNDLYLAQIGGRVYDNFLVSGNYRYRYKAGGVRRDVDDYPSCNLFVRRSILEKIGGYRTDFWPGEDTLLCKDIVDSGARIVYDPWTVVHHHRRAVFGAHLRQLGRYAFHRGYFVKRYPSNSAKLSYFVPSLFVAYLTLLALFVVTVFLIGCKWACSLAVISALPLLAYLLLVTLTALSVNPLTWILTAAGVVATHICYGVKFLQGICAGKAPCEYIGKDHA